MAAPTLLTRKRTPEGSRATAPGGRAGRRLARAGPRRLSREPVTGAAHFHCRVAPARCRAGAPSEPCVPLVAAHGSSKPGGITELRFRLRSRGRKLRVTITPGRARYELLDGEPIAVVHHGKEFQLGKRPNEHDIPKVKVGPRPAQPARRAPTAGP